MRPRAASPAGRPAAAQGEARTPPPFAGPAGGGGRSDEAGWPASHVGRWDIARAEPGVRGGESVRLQWEAMAERSRPGGDTDVVVPRTKAEKATKRPSLFRVLLHNDDYTTQEFVEWVLVEVFRHDPESAHRIMLHVHMHGIGVAGIYPFEIAETKAEKTMSLAREAEYPLLVTVEPE